MCKPMKICWIACLVFSISGNAVDKDSEHGDSEKFVLKVKQHGAAELFDKLHFYNFTKYQLTPSLYILEYNGSRQGRALHKTISKIKRRFNKQIVKLELAREYENTVKPVGRPDIKHPNLDLDSDYGMGDKFVKKAGKQRHDPKLLEEKLHPYITRTTQKGTHTVEFCYECKTSDKSKCLTVLDHVELELQRETRSNIKITILSPSGTMSVFNFKKGEGKQIEKRKVQLASTQFLDEIAFGKWRLHVKDKHSAITGLVLKLYGTTATSSPQTYQHDDYICSSNGRNKKKTSKSKPVTPKAPESTHKIMEEDDDDYFTYNDIVPFLPISVGILLMILLFVYFTIESCKSV